MRVCQVFKNVLRRSRNELTRRVSEGKRLYGLNARNVRASPVSRQQSSRRFPSLTRRVCWSEAPPRWILHSHWTAHPNHEFRCATVSSCLEQDLHHRNKRRDLETVASGDIARRDCRQELSDSLSASQLVCVSIEAAVGAIALPPAATHVVVHCRITSPSDASTPSASSVPATKPGA